MYIPTYQEVVLFAGLSSAGLRSWISILYHINLSKISAFFEPLLKLRQKYAKG